MLPARDRARAPILASSLFEHALVHSPEAIRLARLLTIGSSTRLVAMSQRLHSDIPAPKSNSIPIHRVRRNRQRLPSSLLIENASDLTSHFT